MFTIFCTIFDLSCYVKLQLNSRNLKTDNQLMMTFFVKIERFEYFTGNLCIYICVLGTNLTSPSGPCMDGYYCVSGVDRANPLMLNSSQCPTGTVHPIIGHQCPTGHYCPLGTDYPIGCPAGSYQDLTNQNYCKECPLGHYCYANTSDYTPNICPGGYYCEVNTTDPYQFPCPPGTFNNLTQQHSISACIPCTAGMYCQGHGNSDPTGNCSAGWYCTNGSSVSQVGHITYLPVHSN